jgi:hypothetical protein
MPVNMNSLLRCIWGSLLFITSNNLIMSQSAGIISPRDPFILYMGRIDFSDPERPLFAYPNVTIRARFEGTSISLMLKSYKGSDFSVNYFVSIIDGQDPVKFKVTPDQEVYPLAENLPNGKHTVEVIKVTESYNGECQFLGFRTDPGKKLLKPDPLPDLKIEFFGNSITCGYGIEGGPQPDSDNSYKAYASLAARELNAQFHTTSFSGIGIVRGFAPFVMKEMYNRTIALPEYNPLPSDNTWDFTRFIPGIVVVSLGTNDYSKGLGDGTITVNEFRSEYTLLVNLIRKAYPSALIICTCSPMVSNKKLGSSINDVVSDLKINGDNKVFYFSFSAMKGGGCDGHPSVEDGKINGKELAGFISSLLNSKNR